MEGPRSRLGGRSNVSRRYCIPWVAALLLASGIGHAEAQEPGALAIVNAHVVRPDEGDVLRSQTVLVENGRIAGIGPSHQFAVPERATRIDLGGRYLLPAGAVDDAIVPALDDPHASDLLLAYLTRGIAAIQVTNPHPSQRALAEAVDRGEVRGPRILVIESPGVKETSQPPPPSARDVLLAGVSRSKPDFLAAGEPTGGRSVRPGVRADLVVLEDDPLRDPGSPRRVFGVLVGGIWYEYAALERELEERAREFVERYFQEEELRVVCFLRFSSENDQDMFLPRCPTRPSCRGATLDECMLGERLCARSGTGCWKYAWRQNRAALMRELDLYGAVTPRNDWIAGQRVRFAVSQSNLPRAHGLASSCEGSRWWCQILRGYVAHHIVPGSGDAAFDSAFAAVSAGARSWTDPTPPEHEDRGPACEWVHIAHLLTGPLLREYQALPPCSASSTDFEARFWWLADPLWSTPGNPRRSEHIVRNVQMVLEEEQGSVGPYAQDLWLRSGLWNSWNFIPGEWRRMQPGEVPIRRAPGYPDRYEFYVYGGYSFTPDASRFSDPMGSTPADWAVEWDAGHERMITREEWHDLEHHQTAVLRRGGGLLAISAAQLPVIVSSLDSVKAALAMGRPADRSIEVAGAVIEPSGVLRAETRLEAGDWLASLEIQGPGWVGRARHGAPAPELVDGFGISDPVLVDERFEGGALALRDALLPTTELSGRGAVGIYFEVYGVEPEEPLRVSVTAERTGRSFLQRIAGALRLRADGALTVNWQEPAETPTPGTMPRYLGLDLTGLEKGEYRLEVTVERAGGAAATSARSIRLQGG